MTKIISFILIFNLILLYSSSSANFLDVKENDAYFSKIQDATDNYKFISGYDDWTFRPEDKVTRIEALSSIFKAFDKNINFENLWNWKESLFKDIPSWKWYTPLLNYSKNQGIVNWYEDWTFKWNSYVTRKEFANLVWKIFRFNEVPFDALKGWFQDIDVYSPSNKYINILYQKNIINWKDWKFYPDENITRKEIVLILIRCIEQVQNDKDDLYWYFLFNEWNSFYFKIVNEIDNENLSVEQLNTNYIFNNEEIQVLNRQLIKVDYVINKDKISNNVDFLINNRLYSINIL